MSPPVDVSVVMPVHNGERHLREAIESIFDQSFRNYEFLIVDDGSTDASARIIDEYATRDRRVRVITLPQRAGVAAALNAGIEAATAALIARMDADDIAHPDRFAVQLDVLGAEPELGLVGTRVRLIDDDGRDNPQFDWILPLTHDRCVWQLLFGAPFCHPSVMMRTATVRALDGYDRRFPNEDMELWTRMAFVTRMRNVDAVLIDYRLSERHAEKQKAFPAQTQEVSRRFVERILGRPVAESAVRALQHQRSTGLVEPALSDLEVLAASSLVRAVFDRLDQLGVLDGDAEISEFVVADCQHREAAVLARSWVRA